MRSSGAAAIRDHGPPTKVNPRSRRSSSARNSSRTQRHGTGPSEPYEQTIVEALDALEADRFWAQADAAAAAQRACTDEQRAERAALEAEVDAAFDGVG